MTIEQRYFGNTGLKVGVLGLGTWELGFSKTNDNIVGSILDAAADAGINVLDSAAMYGDAEDMLGRLLVGRRDRFLVFTKCGHYWPKLTGLSRVLRRVERDARKMLGRPSLEWHPKTLQQTIAGSLRRLRTDRIDLIQLHSCSLELLRRGDVISALQRAREAGHVRYIGYSGDGAAAAFAVNCGAFDAIQISVNIADQQALDDIVPKALSAGLGIIAKRPIANAVWRDSELPQDPYMQDYWQRIAALNYGFIGTSDAVAKALRFTLMAGVHTAIVGTTSLHHMRSNIEAVRKLGAGDPDYEEIRHRWREIAPPNWVGKM